MSKKNQETPKITKEELDGLKEVFRKYNEIVNKKASICLEKEIALRNLQKEFDENWQSLEFQSKSISEEQQKYINDLDTKYGQGKSYDLATGEIKDVK